MADVDANINISAQGADEASAALGQVSQGFEGISEEHTKLAGRFNERFQHLGLQLFVGDALRAAGVGRETREVLTILNMTISAFGSALGAAVPYVIGFGAALATAYGIYAKVSDSHKKRADDLQKEIDTTEKEIQSLNTSIHSLEEYTRVTGMSSQAIRDMLSAKKALREFEAKDEIDALEKQIDSLKKLTAEDDRLVAQYQNNINVQKNMTPATMAQISAQTMGMATTQSLAKVYGDFTGKLHDATKAQLQHNDQLKTAQAQLEKLKGGVTDSYDALTKKTKEATDATNNLAKEHGEAVDRINRGIEQMKQRESQYLQDAASNTTRTLEDKNRAVEIWYQRELEREDFDYQTKKKYIEAHIKDVTEQYALLDTLAKQHNANLTALESDKASKTVTIQKKMYNDTLDAAAHAIDATAAKMGDAFAKMAMEGKNFTDGLEHLWRDMAEMFIAEVTRMMIKYLAFMALTGGTGAGPMGKLFGFAEGGSMLVTRPTLMLAGEGGEPEVATFTPLSKLHCALGVFSRVGGGGGGQVTIGAIETNVYGVQDPSRIADEVGRQIVQRIRGMGEIDFVRAS